MSIVGIAVDTYLRLVRAPVEIAVGRFAGEGAGLALDRADARVRSIAGALLGDEGLQGDALRREAAADERARALRLRADAERVEDAGEERAQRTRAAARRQRARRTEQVQSRARHDRLDAAEEKVEALEHAEDALEARDEAERLGNAAAKVKAQRKARAASARRV